MATYPYSSPIFIDEGKEELIHSRMLGYIPNDIDKTEGGFVWDATRPAAIELAQCYIALNNVIRTIFPMFSESIWLDLHGLTRNILRKEAVKAEGTLTVTGTDGTIIPEGFLFATPTDSGDPNIIFEAKEETVLHTQTATGTVTFTGTAGTVIPEGFRVAKAMLDDDGITIIPGAYYLTEEAVTIGEDGTVDAEIVAEETGAKSNADVNTITLIDETMDGVDSVTNQDAVTDGSDGIADVPAIAQNAGTAGNVPADSIVLMVNPMSVITGIINKEAFSGGTDEESDDDLRDRIVVRDLSIGDSYVGSVADYTRWAMSVNGVGGVIVLPTYDGAGTAKIIIADENGEPATQSLIDAVYNYIFSPDDESERLAGVDAAEGGVVIVAPTNIPVTISVSVKLESGYTVEDAGKAFREALKSYMMQTPKDGDLKYQRVGAILIDLPQVADYKDLLVNSDVQNIPVQQDEFPSIEALTVVSYA